jgi:hypothetical protein
MTDYIYMYILIHIETSWNKIFFVRKVELSFDPWYSGRNWSTAPAVGDEVYVKFGGWELAEETEAVLVKQPQYHFVRHMDSPGIESGPLRPETSNKHLRYGTL